MAEDWMSRKLDFFDSETSGSSAIHLLESDTKINRSLPLGLSKYVLVLHSVATATGWGWIGDLVGNLGDIQLSVDGQARRDFLEGIGVENNFSKSQSTGEGKEGK